MRWFQSAVRRCPASFLLLGLCIFFTACGSNTPGRMDWVRPTTSARRVGTVYFIRGWMGIYSAGIDDMAKQINALGGTAYVYMPEQFPELAAAIEERYKNAPQREPICFVGHSRGVDASLIIARELDRAGIPVDMIACLDSVDESVVPKNVRLCYNYWMPGVIGDTNLLRGIPLKQAPGSTGKLFNYNLDTEHPDWRGPLTDHITFDDDPKVQRRIIQNILDVCPERAKWVPPTASPTTSSR